MIDICISSHRKYPFNIISIYLIGNVFLLKFIFFLSKATTYLFNLPFQNLFKTVICFCLVIGFLCLETFSHSYTLLMTFIYLVWLVVCLFSSILNGCNSVAQLCLFLTYHIIYHMLSLSIYFSCHFVFVSLFVFV